MIGPLAPKPFQVMRDHQFVPKTPDGLVLITFDPGGTTGWSRIIMPHIGFRFESIEWILENSDWQHGHIDCSNVDKGAYIMTKMCSEYPTAAVVSESFFLRQMAVDLVPVELIAIVRHHLRRSNRRTLHMQQASMGKRIDNERLKAYGAYTSEGGLNHARDADRHLIMILRRCMENKGWKEKLWPGTIK